MIHTKDEKSPKTEKKHWHEVAASFLCWPVCWISGR